jgi:hypothetical protein
MRHRTTHKFFAAGAAVLASGVLVLANLNGAGTAYAISGPGCITPECPTATATPTDSSAPTDDPSTAAYPTAPGPQPTETDLSPAPTDPTVVLGGATPSDAQPDSGESPDHPYCDAGWDVRPVTYYGGYQYAIGLEQIDKNNTASGYNVDFEETASGTVGVSVSGSIESSINGLIAEAKATFGITISAQASVTVGNVVHPWVMPYHTLYGTFGVLRDKIVGTSTWVNSNCTTSDAHGWTAYGPYGTGWDVWEH